MNKYNKFELVKSFRNKSLKSRDLENLAKALGFIYKRSNGDHRIFEHSISKICIIIPYHGSKEIAYGTKHNILNTMLLCVS